MEIILEIQASYLISKKRIFDEMGIKVVIIAAGLGSRLRKHGNSKPLVPIQGIAILERVIMNVNKIGIKDFFIVIGFNGDKIQEALGNGEKYNVKINYIQNNEWNKGNAISVLKAKPFLSEQFVLMMSDHIFDHTILADLLQIKMVNDECILCIDKTPPDYINNEDATKVYLEEKKIKKIGKSLKNFNAIDTGIFLCTQTLFDELEKCILEGNDSLSAGIQRIADKGKMGFFDIGDRFWIDIDDSEDYKKTNLFIDKLSLTS